jgi:hypothetical protein
MRAFAVLAAAVGLALVAALVVHFGASSVIHSLLAVGWAGFAAICLIQLALIGLMGIAWWVLLPGTSPWAAIWARLVRDSASEVLPLSQVGGYVSGARAIAIAGVSAMPPPPARSSMSPSNFSRRSPTPRWRWRGSCPSNRGRGL